MALMEAAVGFAIFGAILAVLLFGLFVFSFIFWLFMLIDCVKRNFKEDSEKIVWVLVIIFTGIIGALIYYFVVKKKK